MASPKFELATKITRGDKERWQKIGVAFEGERGMYAIIDNIPVGFTGMVSFFEPKPKEGQQPPKGKDIGDDVPW